MSELTPTPEPTPTPAPEPTPQPEPTPEPTPTPSLRDSFKEKVGDDVFKSFEKYADDDSLVNGIVAAQKMVGKKGDIPAEDADDETKAEFWKKLGSDKLDIALPEFGEEFGDTAQQLGEYYGGIKDKVLEIAKDVIPKSGNVSEMLSGIISEFVKQDAEASRLSSIEANAEAEKAFAVVAGKTGLSVDQLKATNEEIIKQNGWTNETHIAEVLYALSKATSNSSVMKDAHLNNTNEGLDAQIESIVASGDLDTIGKKHDIALAKKTALLKKKAEIAERG